MKRTEALVWKIVMTLCVVALVALWTVDIHAAIGRSAPAFSAEDQHGRRVGLSDFSGKIVVLEWLNPDCPYAQRHAQTGTMRGLAERYAAKGVVWLGVNTSKASTRKVNETWASENKLNYPILNDASSAIGRTYGAKTTPQMFVIDKSGKLVYAGAIDDDRDGDKGEARVNYVAKALDEVLAGEDVSIPETNSYGCPVRYR